MQLLPVAIDLNDPLACSFLLLLWSGLFPVILLSWWWKQKICDHNPRKTETSCSLPPHGWAEGTISGLPSVWGGWKRTSVGLEGLRGIGIICGANFLFCIEKCTLTKGEAPGWCSGGVKGIRSQSRNTKGSQCSKICSFGGKNILENGMDKVWWKVGTQGGGGEGKEEQGLEAPFVTWTGEGKRS